MSLIHIAGIDTISLNQDQIFILSRMPNDIGVVYLRHDGDHGVSLDEVSEIKEIEYLNLEPECEPVADEPPIKLRFGTCKNSLGNTGLKKPFKKPIRRFRGINRGRHWDRKRM